MDCPKCKLPMSLVSKENGIEVFRCRTCKYKITRGRNKKTPPSPSNINN